MDTRIYVATHKKFLPVTQDEVYIPLQVGREGKENLGYVSDNLGEHISLKNENYCELTGLYWIWKNVSCDVIGLCHYRRYLVQEPGNQETILPKSYIETMLGTYDMILPDSSRSKFVNVYEHYKDHHKEKDLICCMDVVKEYYPEYETAFLWTLSSNFISLGNIMIARKDLLDQYCEWLFTILFEVERRSDIREYDSYQKRIYGFLSERLLRAWVLMQDIRVREEAVYYVE